MVKEMYTEAELNVIAFDAEDVITTSEFEIENGGDSDFEF